MSLDYTKVYLLNVADSDKEDLLIPTPRDLSGSYRVDHDRTDSLYIYNEDIGVSDWGLEIPYPDSGRYSKIRDIYSACYGTIHDYRYDTSDGTSYMEYVREVRSVTGVCAYYFIAHCASEDYVPSRSISRYLASWSDDNPYNAEEVDYETLAINFCYSNPSPEIFQVYSLPLISESDWGKYLRVSASSGRLVWDPVSSEDLGWILEDLSSISGIPANRHPAIPAIWPPAASGPYSLFLASIPESGDTLSSVTAVLDPTGKPDPVQSSLLNAGWHLSSSGRLDYLVADFPVSVLPEPGSFVQMDIGDCYFKFSFKPSYTTDCVLDGFLVSSFDSPYVYTPGQKDLEPSQDPVPCIGVSGTVATKPSRTSGEILSFPFEFRFSLADSGEASD